MTAAIPAAIPAGGIAEFAPAKLNLALHVTGRRDDGYHLLDSLVCFADAGDRVTLHPGAPAMEVSGPFGAGLGGPDDLCLRALRLAGARARVALEKNLPVASGIGGGSADAAAVLRALARAGVPLPADTQRLGADVPVCVAGRPTRMRGVGEVLDPVAPLPPLHLVLVNPGVALSTPQVFAGLARTDGTPLPPLPAMADARAVIDWCRAARNDLEPAAIALRPVIADVLAALTAAGAGFARMSGSGATCFGIFATPAQAADAADRLGRGGWWARACELASPPAGG